MTVQVEPDLAHSAGHALIRVPGAAGAVNAPGFRLQRDAGWGDDKLGPGGWQSSDALLVPDRAETSGGDLVLYVGWGVCRYLEAGVYELSVPGAGLAQVGVYWPDIVPLHSGISLPVVVPAVAAVKAAAPLQEPKQAPAPEPPAPLPLPAPIVSQAPAETLVRPLAEPPPPAPGIAKTTISASGVLLLLLLAGIGYYYWTDRASERTESAQAPPAPSAPTVAPTSAPAPAGLGGLSVPDVLTQAPNPAAIAAEGEQRLRGDRHDDGLLLLEAAADRSDPAAAAALARLYDPVLFRPGGPIPQPDPRQAARYYRDAARGGADVAAAREALRQDLQARVQRGDLGANLSLKDFWP